MVFLNVGVVDRFGTQDVVRECVELDAVSENTESNLVNRRTSYPGGEMTVRDLLVLLQRLPKDAELLAMESWSDSVSTRPGCGSSTACDSRGCGQRRSA